MSFAGMMLAGLMIDLAIGWPGWLHARIGHPVTWLGAAIAWLERRFNRGTRNIRIGMGALCVALILTVVSMVIYFMRNWGVVLGAER